MPRSTCCKKDVKFDRSCGHASSLTQISIAQTIQTAVSLFTTNQTPSKRWRDYSEKESSIVCILQNPRKANGFLMSNSLWDHYKQTRICKTEVNQSRFHSPKVGTYDINKQNTSFNIK